MRIHELDTPAVVCDLDVLEHNIRDMAKRCRDLEIPLRCHIKSHKLPDIAHMQLAAGAAGVCCQKLGEAETMVNAGIHDIFIPFNIVGPTKIERLWRLARRANITVAIDSLATAQGISEGFDKKMGATVRALVELDTGGQRCGVQSPQDALTLARQLVDLPGIDLQGVATFPSQPRARSFLDETVTLLRNNGITVNVISGGGTGSEAISKELGCTETRSGSYVWEGLSRIQSSNDLSPKRCPIRLITTVVSTPTSDRIIIDGGMKTFASYPPNPYGHCVEHPEIKIYTMSVEHGHVDVSASQHTFKVGERLSIIPLHAGMTVNMHDEVVGYRGDQAEVFWPLAGRGKVK